MSCPIPALSIWLALFPASLQHFKVTGLKIFFYFKHCCGSGSGFTASTWFWASWIRSRIRSRIRILLSFSKNNKKNLDFYCFVTSFWLFIFEKWCKCVPSSKSNMKKNCSQKISFLLASWKSMMKIAGSTLAPGSISQMHGSEDLDPDPDPPQNVMDPQHWF